MFCSCANICALKILMQETPTKTWAESVMRAHIYIDSW